MKTIFAVLFFILAIFGGLGTGLGLFAYSIYGIVLMLKGVVAVTFFGIFKVVALWVCAAFGGWLVFFIFIGLAGFCGLKRSKSRW